MSSSSEVRFEFPEMRTVRSAGPLEKLWQSTSSYGTMFLSGDEVHRLEDEARSLGIMETESRLRAEHERTLSGLRSEVINALAAFEHEKQNYFRCMEKEVVRLALAVARKVIGHEMTLDVATLSPAIRQILDQLEHSEETTLLTSPTESAPWEKALSGNAILKRAIIVKPDPNMPPGRCKLISGLGTTVFDPLSHLDEIEQEFARIADSHNPPAVNEIVQ